MNKLLKDAIADAKAVRETALANAKQALQEAFTPKLQSMISNKIKEEMDDEAAEEELEAEQADALAGVDEPELEVTEAEGEEDTEDAPVEDEVPTEEAPEEEVPSEDVPTEDDSMDSEEMPEEEDEPVEDEATEDDDQELSDDDLAELLRELEGEEEQSEDEEGELELSDEDVVAENEQEASADSDEGEIDLDEVIKALKEEKKPKPVIAPKAKAKDYSKDLREAYDTIKYLRTQLNEVNLLNAKLLYVNKVFRKGTFSEAQKVQIIETFDRAKSAREAKLIYATLAESMAKTAVKKPNTLKKQIKEGVASAAQKKTNKPVVNANEALYSRFNELVNFNKQ